MALHLVVRGDLLLALVLAIGRPLRMPTSQFGLGAATADERLWPWPLRGHKAATGPGTPGTYGCPPPSRQHHSRPEVRRPEQRTRMRALSGVSLDSSHSAFIDSTMLEVRWPYLLPVKAHIAQRSAGIASSPEQVPTGDTIVLLDICSEMLATVAMDSPRECSIDSPGTIARARVFKNVPSTVRRLRQDPQAAWQAPGETKNWEKRPSTVSISHTRNLSLQSLSSPPCLEVRNMVSIVLRQKQQSATLHGSLGHRHEAC